MTLTSSPFDSVPQQRWQEITEGLVKDHPLSMEVILETANAAWEALWSTRIGDGESSLGINEIDPPTTVIGYFFEKLLALKLANRFPAEWRGGKGSEKDLHYIPDPSKSIEVKSSGQLGMKIYGNRSYSQELEDSGLEKKDKSGYFITVNFFGSRLTMLRFGWIDSTDWKPQRAPTGQMAGLGEEVYAGKLKVIPGAYLLEAPVMLLSGVGEKTATGLSEKGIRSIKELLSVDSGAEFWFRKAETSRRGIQKQVFELEKPLLDNGSCPLILRNSLGGKIHIARFNLESNDVPAIGKCCNSSGARSNEGI